MVPLDICSDNSVRVALRSLVGVGKYKHFVSRIMCTLKFRPHSFFKQTVDYVHHLVIHDVLYSVRNFDEWMVPKVHFSLTVYTLSLLENQSMADSS